MSGRAIALGLLAAWLGAALPALATVTEDLAAGKIPLYPGAKPHPIKVEGQSQALAILEANPESVVEFYRRELPKRGWQASEVNGVLSENLDQVPLALLLFERDRTRLRVVVARGKGHKTSLWLATEPRR